MKKTSRVSEGHVPAHAGSGQTESHTITPHTEAHATEAHISAPHVEVLTFSDFQFLGFGTMLAFLGLQKLFLASRLFRKRRSRLAVALWLSLTAVWVVTLITTFLQAKTLAGVMRGNLIAVALSLVVLVAAFFGKR